MEDKEKTVLFSGRFDRSHPGHFRTIDLLGQRYKKVLVVVLDYPEQSYPACYRKQILDEHIENTKGEYEVVLCGYHFAKISIDELLKFKFEVYAAGNIVVIEHLEKIRNTCPKTSKGGERYFDIIWVNRPYDYDAATERLGRKVQEMR